MLQAIDQEKVPVFLIKRDNVYAGIGDRQP
jgi:hypothetical protein